jgi:sugar lactone lactonase YvrE
LKAKGDNLSQETQGGDMNQLNNPSDVSVYSDGTVYVLDSQNYRIQNGNQRNYWYYGNLNTYSSRFSVDTNGNIYVLNQYNHQIQKWTKKGGLWTTVAGGNGEAQPIIN